MKRRQPKNFNHSCKWYTVCIFPRAPCIYRFNFLWRTRRRGCARTLLTSLQVSAARGIHLLPGEDGTQVASADQPLPGRAAVPWASEPLLSLPEAEHLARLTQLAPLQGPHCLDALGHSSGQPVVFRGQGQMGQPCGSRGSPHTVCLGKFSWFWSWFLEMVQVPFQGPGALSQA